MLIRFRQLLILFISFQAIAAHGDENSIEGTDLAELESYPHKIVFESYDVDNWELSVINADGTGRRKLTNTPHIHELYPQASPDGKRICFLADTQQDGKTLRSVYTMNTDGSQRVLVAERSRQPCWSSDSTRIAFVKQEFSRFRLDDYVSKLLYTYNVGSGATRQHPNSKIHHLYGLSWSGSGEWLVATVHGGMGYGHAILAIEMDGSNVFDLQIPGCRPCLSPDGSHVTWSRNDHTICVADVEFAIDGAKASNIRVVDQHEALHLYHPDFSPDGKYITYSVGPGGRVQADGPGTHTAVAEMVGVRGKWDLFLKPVDGSGPRVQLTFDESLSNKESDWLFVPDDKVAD